MKILLVGHGGREHALAEALTKSGQAQLYSVMEHANPGIISHSDSFALKKTTDAEAVCKFALEHAVDFAVFGPEAPLVAGVADELQDDGVPCFGPARKFAQLEGSKAFTRALTKKHSIPGTPNFRVFDNREKIGELEEYVKQLGECVVKADGLMAGKGVKVWGEHLHSAEEAVAWAQEVFSKGMRVMVEEKLEGEEFSLQSITDGETLLHCPPVQDHKRAFDNDRGPNTGGMGSYSCENGLLPFLEEEDVEEARQVTEKVLKALNGELGGAGGKYCGVMYGGFIATRDGVKLLEYNARFGDPEAMNVLPLLKNDFAQVCKLAVEGNLAQVKKLDFQELATVCKYVVPEGYPDNPLRGEKISVDVKAVEQSGANLYYGSVEQHGEELKTTSSRSLGILGIGKNIVEAEEKARAALEHVRGRIFYRKDVGTQQLIQKRVEHMRSLRSRRN